MKIKKSYYITDEYGCVYASDLATLHDAEERQCELYGYYRSAGYPAEDMPDFEIHIAYGTEEE